MTPTRLALTLLVVAGAVYVRRLGSPGGLFDEGFLLVFADRVSRGAVAHRDFYSIYGPAGPWLLGGLFKVFGPSLGLERALGAAARLLLALSLFSAGRRTGMAYGAAAFLIATLWGVVLGPAAHASVLGVAVLTAGVVLGASDQAAADRRLTVLAGLLVGLAGLFRAELLVIGLLAALPALAWRGAGLRLSWLGGLAAGLAPFAIHLLVAGPSMVFENLVRYSLLLAVPARQLPIPPAETRALAFFLLTAGAAAAAGVVAVLALRRRRPDGNDLNAGSVAMLSLGITVEALHRVDIDHLALVAMVSVSALPVYVGYRYASTASWRPGRRSLAAVCGLLLLPIGFAGWRPPAAAEVEARGRTFEFASPQVAEATRATLRDLDRVGRPGQRLIVAPADLYRSPLDDADLYWLAPQFVPGTYFIQVDPGLSNRAGSGLDREIAAADLLVLAHYDADYPDPYVPRNAGGAAPTAAVAANFCEVASHPPYTVLTRCSH